MAEETRCPACGQATEGNKKELHDKLRQATADALERARVETARAEEAETDRNDLRRRLDAAEQELRRLRVVESGVLTGSVPAVTPPTDADREGPRG